MFYVTIKMLGDKETWTALSRGAGARGGGHSLRASPGSKSKDHGEANVQRLSLSPDFRYSCINVSCLFFHALCVDLHEYACFYFCAWLLIVFIIVYISTSIMCVSVLCANIFHVYNWMCEFLCP